MAHLNKVIIVTILAVMLFLSACGGAATPTTDPYLVYTQAAETVAVQLTLTAAALPTSTQTLEPTATAIPVTETPTSIPVTPTPLFTLAPTIAGPTLPPAATVPVQKTGDAAVLGSQSPADGTTFLTGQEFQVMFSLVNMGTTTWTPEYSIVFTGGQGLSSVTSVQCGRMVKPNEKCEFYISGITPPSPGKYKSSWKLVNAQGAYIYDFYLLFTVQ